MRVSAIYNLQQSRFMVGVLEYGQAAQAGESQMVSSEASSLLRVLSVLVQQHNVALSMSGRQNNFHVLCIPR